jgi:hypothetical protein
MDFTRIAEFSEAMACPAILPALNVSGYIRA